MSQKLKRIVAPLGHETGLTEDGFLASGMARNTQYVLLDDRTGQTVPLQKKKPTIPGRRIQPKKTAAPCLTRRLKTDAAFYITWPFFNEQAIDFDISVAVIEQLDTTPIGREEGSGAVQRAYCSYQEPEILPYTKHGMSGSLYALWLNQDDTTGEGRMTDPADVSFEFNERILIAFSELPEIRDLSVALFGHFYSAHDYADICPDRYWSQLPSALSSELVFRRRDGRKVRQEDTPDTETEGFYFGLWRRYPETDEWVWEPRAEGFDESPAEFLEYIFGEIVPFPDE